MITRKELLKSKEYWLVKFQVALYEQVENYLKENKLTKSQFAEKLGVSKGYISQILNGNFDHKLSKFVELSLAINKVPLLKFEDIEKCILLDKKGKLDNLEYPEININVTINYSKHARIKKSETSTTPISFEKEFSEEYSPFKLKEKGYPAELISLT